MRDHHVACTTITRCTSSHPAVPSTSHNKFPHSHALEPRNCSEHSCIIKYTCIEAPAEARGFEAAAVVL
jgi:hypothetical protein